MSTVPLTGSPEAVTIMSPVYDKIVVRFTSDVPDYVRRDLIRELTREWPLAVSDYDCDINAYSHPSRLDSDTLDIDVTGHDRNRKEEPTVAEQIETLEAIAAGRGLSIMDLIRSITGE